MSIKVYFYLCLPNQCYIQWEMGQYRTCMNEYRDNPLYGSKPDHKKEVRDCALSVLILTAGMPLILESTTPILALPL